MPLICIPFVFRKEQLRDIVESFLTSDSKNEFTRPLLLAVIEKNASFSVFDGFTIIPVRFTDKSLNATCLKLIDDNTLIMLGDLSDKIILVTKWNLQVQNSG